MDATLLAMIHALYPDMVEIKFVPSDHVRVLVPLWDNSQFRDKATPNNTGSVPYNFEEVQLQELCEGCEVYAGMSEVTHIVFVKVDGL